MDDTKTYIKLKHYPPQGTIEYLNSLPPGISFGLYKKLFADGETGSIVEIRLLYVLSNPNWHDIVWKRLEALLVDYYEAHEIKQRIINNMELEWIKKPKP